MTEDELFARLLADPQVQCEAIRAANPTRTVINIYALSPVATPNPPQGLWCVTDDVTSHRWSRADMIRECIRQFPTHVLLHRLDLRPLAGGGELV